MTAKKYIYNNDTTIIYFEDELKWEYGSRIENDEDFAEWYGEQENGFETWLDDEGLTEVR